MAKGKTVRVGTSGVTGGETKEQEKAYVSIRDRNEELNIEVDCYEGQGKTFKPREELLVTIGIGNRTFVGTVKELEKLLF